MVKGSSRMDKQNTGDASNSKGTVTMTVLQHFLMKMEADLKKKEAEEAELKKQLEATQLQGDKLKAWEKNIDPILLRVRNNDFEGLGLEEMEKCHDMLVKIQSMTRDHVN